MFSKIFAALKLDAAVVTLEALLVRVDLHVVLQLVFVTQHLATGLKD